MVKLRVAWWFKFHRKGSKEPITYILLNIKDLCSVSSCTKAPVVESWRPPPVGSLKFNVDGSSKGNPGQAGIGGVLRDCDSKVLGSFSANVGFKDSISAEMMGIHKAMELCVKSTALFGTDIIFSSDSMAAVSWINGEGIGSTEHFNLIYDIRDWLSHLENAMLVFNPRSSNTVADQLARKGADSSGMALSWDFI